MRRAEKLVTYEEESQVKDEGLAAEKSTLPLAFFVIHGVPASVTHDRVALFVQDVGVESQGVAIFTLSMGVGQCQTHHRIEAHV